MYSCGLCALAPKTGASYSISFFLKLMNQTNHDNMPGKPKTTRWRNMAFKLGDDRSGKTLVVLACAIFLAYLLPQWLSLFLGHGDYIYVNAWDEETYLSWQGILGAKDTPGYLVLYLPWLLHRLGMPGSLQNLLFDTLLTPLTVWLIYRAIRTYGRDRAQAFGLAVVVLFGAVLFNYANPLVAWLYGSARDLTLLLPGWERYPSALRTPNPQFSYLLIALAFYLFRRYGKWWVLLIPLPVGYYFAMVPYTLCLMTAGIWHLARRRGKQVSALLPALGAYLALGSGLLVQAKFSRLLDADSPLRLDSYAFLEQRMPTLPLAGVAALLLLCWLFFRRKVEASARHSLHAEVLFGLAVIMLLTCNIQLVTGFMLSHKNYVDYGVSALAGVFLAVALDYCVRHQPCPRISANTLLSAVLTPILIFTIPMQIVWFMRAWPGLTQADTCALERARADPLHAIIPDISLSSKFAYAHARALIPPFSYQYNFPYIATQCRYYPELVRHAFIFAQQQIDPASPELHALAAAYRDIAAGAANNARLGYAALPYCRAADYQMDQFIYVPLALTVKTSNPCKK